MLWFLLIKKIATLILSYLYCSPCNSLWLFLSLRISLSFLYFLYLLFTPCGQIRWAPSGARIYLLQRYFFLAIAPFLLWGTTVFFSNCVKLVVMPSVVKSTPFCPKLLIWNRCPTGLPNPPWLIIVTLRQKTNGFHRLAFQALKEGSCDLVHYRKHRTEQQICEI